MPIEGDWLTVSEAAKLCDYNPESITRLIREGKIKATKVSIVWLVDRQSLLEYLGKVQKLGEKRGRKPEDLS
jgi:excisionase family DNA binding protein